MATERKKRFSDRYDGRRLRTLDPFSAMIPFIMKSKSEASNYFSDTVEITEIEKYLNKKRKEGYPGIGMLHIFVAVFVRIVAQYPAINRFCSGQRIHARHDIDFIMVIKKQMKTSATETSIKLKFSPSDTIDDVYFKLKEEIEKVKLEKEVTGADRLTHIFMKLPRLLLRFAIGLLQFLDYFGIMPKSILNESPFHGSVIITDLGSIGLPAIYHHLYNFGNLPFFIAIGAKKKVNELDADGNAVAKKYVEYKLVVDERICDGFYFSQAFKYFRSLLKKPEKLEEPPEVINEDID